MTATDAAEVAEGLARDFGLELDAPSRETLASLHRPRFNVAPGTGHWVLSSRRRPIAASWGLVRKGRSPQINARIESIAAGRYPPAVVHAGRCMVLADGFYEWGGKPRSPWHLRPEHGTWLAMAAIARRDVDGTPHFAIVTRPADTVVEPIHNRMPQLLDRASMRAWLDRDLPVEGVVETLESLPEVGLLARRVSKHVNDPSHDDAACLAAAEPLSPSQMEIG